MKFNFIRISVLIISIAMILIAITVTATADNELPVVFTVEHPDGSIVEYRTSENFEDAIKKAPTGSIITLFARIHVSESIYVYGTEVAPKEITIDLGGFGIYVTSKTAASTMLRVGDYGTLNVTSSKPDAFLYMIDMDSNSKLGGNIFCVNGVNALANLGGVVSVKGNTYPGSNISTFSSCFVDTRGEGTVGFNCDGGQHFANIADWAGFINPRNGTGTITIKNSDILIDKNENLIHSEDSRASLYLENCLIYRLDGTDKYMFNQALASVTIKNCKTNYSMVASAESGNGVVTLEGNNVFGAGFGYSAELLANGTGKVAARTHADCVLVQGGVNYWRYDNVGNFNKYEETLLGFGEIYDFVLPENTYKCTWKYYNEEKEELWIKGVAPNAPFEFNPGGKEGFYKKGWLKTQDNEAGIVYKLTDIVDFNIKAQCEDLGFGICYNIYIPAFIIDEGYISFTEGRIDGAVFALKDWDAVEIDGQKYYKYETADISKEEIDRVIEISIPCDMRDANKFVKAEGIWRINLSKYLEIAYKNAENYTDDQLARLEELKNEYFAENSES